MEGVFAGMKVVSFTMVNNEGELIESFVRYNYNFLDKMIIIDNGSTDNTVTIVNNLKKEGYNIELYDESLETYNQFSLDNKYLKKIINEDSADIVIPLDADEFLGGADDPRKLLESLSLNQIYYVHWKWYVLTGEEDESEAFIPKRLEHRFKEYARNYSDNSFVTKVILPVKYFKENKLTLTMGHHDVFGNSNIRKKELDELFIAHYRAIGERQIISKTRNYVIRDIATMTNNNETAQRTNQLNQIENGSDIKKIAQEVSFGGYTGDIIYDPLNLKYCDKKSLTLKYQDLSSESMEKLLMRTGQEMAVKVYNLERKRQNHHLLKPIILWMDGVKGESAIFPNPSKKLVLLTAKYHVEGYLTDNRKIEFLKSNYRLVVGTDYLKFIPHKYVVIPDTVDIDEVRKSLTSMGIPSEQILSIAEYEEKLGILSKVYANIMFIPGMIQRVYLYYKRNGLSTMINKLKKYNR